MDSQDRSINLKRLVKTLRRVTTAVQILPFVYSSTYIVLILLENHISGDTKYILDSLFYVSPVMIVCFLLLSRVLRLCKWNKTACIIPAIPQFVSLVDYYIISLEDVYVYTFNFVLAGMVALLLVAAYKVFFK